jgi:hypothetical protein
MCEGPGLHTPRLPLSPHTLGYPWYPSELRFGYVLQITAEAGAFAGVHTYCRVGPAVALLRCRGCHCFVLDRRVCRLIGGECARITASCINAAFQEDISAISCYTMAGPLTGNVTSSAARKKSRHSQSGMSPRQRQRAQASQRSLCVTDHISHRLCQFGMRGARPRPGQSWSVTLGV